MKKYPFHSQRISSTTALALYLMNIIIFTSVCIPAQAQTKQKKAVISSGYPLWHYLEAEDISDNGSWISYKKTYDTADSLFVVQRKTGKTHSFLSGSQGHFAAVNYFLCITPDSVVHILSLQKGSEKLLKNVTAFEILGSKVITLLRQKEGSSLSIHNLEGGLIFRQNNVLEYAMCPDNKKIAITVRENQKSFVRILTISSAIEKHQLAEASSGQFQKLTWSPDSSVLAFMQYGQSESKLYYYQSVKKAMSTFSTADTTVFPMKMNMQPRRKLKISPDNKRIFFSIRQRKEFDNIPKKNEVQIWNSADKYIYPTATTIDKWNNIDKQACWEPRTGTFVQFTDQKLPHGAPARAMNYALMFNPQDYEPQSKSNGDRDIYIADLTTGKRTLILKKHISNTTNLLCSPGGKYISYFKQGNWFVYNVSKGTHTQINTRIPFPLAMEGGFDEDDCYGNPGWTASEEYLLLYDQYDLWKVSPDGSTAERLTTGREKGIVFRIVPQNINEQTRADLWIHTSGAFDLKTGLVLKGRSVDFDQNGIFLWDQKKPLSEIIYTSKRISTILRSKNNIFAWMEEDTDLPWRIQAKEPKHNEKLVLQSNIHQEQFMWTNRDIITYENDKGETLTGILYYPSSYEKGKQYPMVVNVYEKQSYQIHYYHLPTLYNGDGFNVGNLTSKGYFVLLPDITYETGNVGRSAVDCVEAAVKAALKNNDIDQKRVGLIGHSFGGSETDFIITKSTIFACAVAGAATTNYLSSYLAVSPNMGIPNFYKMEYGQARMKVSPYENMDIYLKNSPVINAAGVTTPLLSWTGMQDQQVLPTQSFEFYMALRRLGKTHVMLAYPDEGHDISAKDNAIDLTRRIEAWFDYYLQGSEKPSWLL